jgi:hypothetical protein
MHLKGRSIRKLARQPLKRAPRCSALEIIEHQMTLAKRSSATVLSTQTNTDPVIKERSERESLSHSPFDALTRPYRLDALLKYLGELGVR